MFTEESELADSFTERWARRFLYAVIVLQAVPFFGIPTGLDWLGIRRLNLYKLIVAVLILGLLSARLNRVRAALQSRARQVALCSAFAVWLGLLLGSIAYRPGLRSNLEIFLLYWTPSLLVFAYLLLVYPATRRRSLVFSLAAFYALALMLGYFEWFTWKNPTLDSFFLQFREVAHYKLGEFLRISGTLGMQGMAEAVIIGLPIVVGLAWEGYKSRRWVIFTLALVLIPTGLILLLRTFLRHPLIVVLVEVLAFVGFTVLAKKSWRLLVAGVGAVLLSFLLGWGLIIAQGHGCLLLARYLGTSQLAQASQHPADSRKTSIVRSVEIQAERNISVRLVGYKVSWQIMQDWPWTGVGMGPDGFLPYWKNLGPSWWSERRHARITHAHNFYLQMFVSGGLLAGLGFLGLVLLILRKGWIVWRKRKLSGESQLRPVEIGVLTAVVGVLVSMLLDFKYNLQWSTLILWVLLGTAILILDEADGHNSRQAVDDNKAVGAGQES